jgi:hypothetical protein
MQESCVSVCRETANRLPASLPDPSRVWWSEGTQCPFHSFLVLHSLHSLTSALTPPHARRGALACHGEAQRRALCGPFLLTRECIAQNHPSDLAVGWVMPLAGVVSLASRLDHFTHGSRHTAHAHTYTLITAAHVGVARVRCSHGCALISNTVACVLVHL